jgi:hypothetical protein
MSTLKTSATATALILILSLGTWLFFYWESIPLDAKGTAVVAGMWALVVLSAKYCWAYLGKRRGQK